MPAANRRVVQREVGSPESVAELEHGEVPTPGPGELLVELVLAPINPAEVLMLQGEYGYRETVPPLPRFAGIEGVGRVVGGATDAVPLGSFVSLAGTAAVFGDYRVIPAEQAFVLPEDVDADTVAVAFVNTQAVLVMLHEWSEVGPGDWIVQNAANSGYGRILDAVAARRGVRLVNVVRSSEAAKQLDGSSGPVVVDGDDLEARVLEATDGVRPLVAADAVGGTATGRLASTLVSGGRVVTYGLMSGEPCQIDTRLIVFGGIRLEGFWMPRSMPRLDAAELAGIGSEALDVIRSGAVSVPIERRYGLDDVATALAHAAQGGRVGKVVLTR
jgi:NADPH:quinone reductase-like Zn-dependent oxidoreductase